MFESPMIAIDIGTFETKVIAGNWKGNSLRLTSAFIVPTPDNTYSDGYILDGDGLATQLQQSLKTHRVKKGEVIFTTDSSEIILREVVLPWAPEKQLQAMLPFEVEKHFPVRIQEYVLVHQVMNEFTEDQIKKVGLLVAAMPKEMVEGYWKLAAKLELKPAGLEMQAESMPRLFSNLFAGKTQLANISGTFAHIDMGHRKLRVSFASQGKIAFSRTFSHGGWEMDERIAQALDVPLAIAREKKHLGSLVAAEGNESLEQQRVRELIQEKVDQWLQEIQPVFRYYLGLGDTNRIDGIFIYGGPSRITGMAKYIQEVFNRPVLTVEEGQNIFSLNSNGEKFPLDALVNAGGSLIQERSGD